MRECVTPDTSLFLPKVKSLSFLHKLSFDLPVLGWHFDIPNVVCFVLLLFLIHSRRLKETNETDRITEHKSSSSFQNIELYRLKMEALQERTRLL